MTTKLKCLLLDDELPALSYLKLLCEQIPGVEVVKAFNDPVKFMEASTRLNFNACILDIQMPGLNGLEVAKGLSGKLIIFTTAYKEFAAEAFDLNAVDYIRKPLQKERFEQAMAKAMAQLQSSGTAVKSHAIWLTDKGKTLLSFDEILYVASSATDSRDKWVYLDKGRKSTIKNTGFGQLLEVLPAARFCRINKKEILALKTVSHFSANKIMTEIRNPEHESGEFFLSEVYREEFQRKLSAL